MSYKELKDHSLTLEALANWRLHWQITRIEGLLDGKPLSLELAQESRARAEADIEHLIMEINNMFGDDCNGYDVKKLDRYQEYLSVRQCLEETAVKQHVERQRVVAHKALRIYEFR